jgi:tetratricopeptide (TPR) repeat protein
LNSKNYAYYSNLSEIYKENNDISKAVKYASEAITLNSSNAYLYSQRGSLYGNYLNDFDKANKDFSKSIALDPENWAHYYFRAEFLLKQNRLIEAKLDLDYLYQYKLLNYMVLNTFGKYYIKINSFNEALNSLNISLSMEPNNSEAYYLRSLVFTKLNKKHDAISDLSKSIKIDSTNSDAYYQRGLQYYDLGKYHLAQKDFNNSLKFSKGSKLKELSLNKLNELSMLIK